MTKTRNSGLAFHVHHDQLVEWCFDYDERVKYITSDKPASERELRLRLFRLIPLSQLPGKQSAGYKALTEAGQKCDEAVQKLTEAVQKRTEAVQKLDEAGQKRAEAGQKLVEAEQKYDEAVQKYGEAGQKRDEAGQKLTEARQKYNNKYLPSLKLLHLRLCPDCPWDGKTIFPNQN